MLGPAQLWDFPVSVGGCRSAALAGLLAGSLGGAVRDPRRFLGRHAQVPQPLVECLVLDAGPCLLLYHVSSNLYTARFAASRSLSAGRAVLQIVVFVFLQRPLAATRHEPPPRSAGPLGAASRVLPPR